MARCGEAVTLRLEDLDDRYLGEDRYRRHREFGGARRSPGRGDAGVRRFRIELTSDAIEDLARLDRPVGVRIQKFLRDRVGRLEDPRPIGS